MQQATFLLERLPEFTQLAARHPWVQQLSQRQDADPGQHESMADLELKLFCQAIRDSAAAS